jgi:hypothetical protein
LHLRIFVVEERLRDFDIVMDNDLDIQLTENVITEQYDTSEDDEEELQQ